MALSEEVLHNIQFAEMLGLNRANLLPISQTRGKINELPPVPHPTPVAEVVNTTVPGSRIPVRIYIPEGQGPFPVLSYFHGGGFVLMSIETVDEICRQLCAGAGCIVMSVGYRLAPEHPYPAGPDDCVAAAKWMIGAAGKYGGLGEKMAVAGDSAGGYMAIATAQKLKLAGISLCAQVAAYPVTDHYSSHHASWGEDMDAYGLPAVVMKWFWDNFLPDASKAEEASPLRTRDFAGLAPAMIITCQYDVLRDEGKAYADKLKEAGVETVYENYENAHGFFGVGEMGELAMGRVCAFLKARFKES